MANTISTIQGDTWDIISFRVYGIEKYIGELIESNPEHRKTVFFPAGVILTIPTISTPVNTKLPPWKRGV